MKTDVQKELKRRANNVVLREKTESEKSLERLTVSQLQIMELCENHGDYWWAEWVSTSDQFGGPGPEISAGD